MSAGSTIPYRLRPNKAVDRELFVIGLQQCVSFYNHIPFQYVGLGGPFLDDFRHIHTKVGIEKLISCETDYNTYQRQKFNAPFECITCLHKAIEDYIRSTEFQEPIILWLDYTVPKDVPNQIAFLAECVVSLPLNSIIKITLNASPTCLGSPDPEEKPRPNLQEYRLQQFLQIFGSMAPSNLEPENFITKNYGLLLLRTSYLQVDSVLSSVPNRGIMWFLSTHYADGQPMVTATGFVHDPEDVTAIKLVNKLEQWTFYSVPTQPLIFDLPVLSSLERLFIESYFEASSILGYNLPGSDLVPNSLDSFRRFYKVFPHFTRVDL